MVQHDQDTFRTWCRRVWELLHSPIAYLEEPYGVAAGVVAFEHYTGRVSTPTPEDPPDLVGVLPDMRPQPPAKVVDRTTRPAPAPSLTQEDVIAMIARLEAEAAAQPNAGQAVVSADPDTGELGGTAHPAKVAASRMRELLSTWQRQRGVPQV